MKALEIIVLWAALTAAIVLPTIILAAALGMGLRCGLEAAGRAALRVLRLIDRTVYALGLDSRQVAARWRERGL